MNIMTRRQATKLIGTAAAGFILPAGTSQAESSPILTRAIPSSGEKLPVIGLGTAKAFDVDLGSEAVKALEQVLSLFVKVGGKVVDTSPMYGNAEAVIGALAARLGFIGGLFLATKVWTRGKDAGIQSMERSMERLRTKKIDLMQVHNLVDVETQLGTLRAWKEQGRIRYIGITHYQAIGHEAVEKLMRSEKLDFIQINYSIMEREAEQRILPLAQDRQVAVLANRPFGAGDLFSRVRAKPLPDWASEFDCRSWAQFFLKWIAAHPAVTCAIPATNNPQHLEDNMRAGVGRLPNDEMRRRMIDFLVKI
jgi:diketogulonate reductase-like aldo/keto reductase